MLTQYEIEVLSVVTTIVAICLSLGARRLGAGRRDSSIYPFISATFCFFTCVPYGSYIAGIGFISSALVGIVMYKND